MRPDLTGEFHLDLHPDVAGESTRLFDNDVPPPSCARLTLCDRSCSIIERASAVLLADQRVGMTVRVAP